jgi:hypothetical protein
MSSSLVNLQVPLLKTHELFQRLVDGDALAAARAFMDVVFAEFRDVDGNFVRELQTGGFSARVFELALFAYLREHGLELDRSHPAPDFVVRGRQPVAIEVTTTNPRQGIASTPLSEYSPVPADLETADREFVHQIGKAIRKKMQHVSGGLQYWQQPHLQGAPFVVAVGAFHNDHAHWHPMSLVAEYLYGQRSALEEVPGRPARVVIENIDDHEFGGRTIPSGLFMQPDSQDLAGVLFSNSHTIGKFNRIGIEHGYGVPGVTVVRRGICYDPDPKAVLPREFGYEVVRLPRDSGMREDFAEGLHLFLNPWASTSLAPEALPGITVWTIIDSVATTCVLPAGLHPYMSTNINTSAEKSRPPT